MSKRRSSSPLVGGFSASASVSEPPRAETCCARPAGNESSSAAIRMQLDEVASPLAAAGVPSMHSRPVNGEKSDVARKDHGQVPVAGEFGAAIAAGAANGPDRAGRQLDRSR
jgi:hypothetical protein